MMTLFDLILILIVFAFTLGGFWFGLIRTLGALIGVILGAIVAGFFTTTVVDYFFTDPGNGVYILSFFILFGLTQKIVHIAVVILDKFFKVVSIIPFLKSINRLAGALLGFIEGSLVVGLALYLLARFPVNFIQQMLLDAQYASFFLAFGKIIAPLLPEMIRMLPHII